MGIWDNLADRQFAKDESGRLVFLPRGPRRTAYLVATTDEPKIKSLVKIYVVAAALINLIGSTASIASAQAIAFGDRCAPLAHKLKLGLIVYAISAMLFYIGPGLLLWNVYRRALDGLCSSFPAVDPRSQRLVQLRPNPRRAQIILLFAGLVVLGLGIFAAISYRP